MEDFNKLKEWLREELNTRGYNPKTRMDVWSWVKETERNMNKLSDIKSKIEE